MMVIGRAKPNHGSVRLLLPAAVWVATVVSVFARAGTGSAAEPPAIAPGDLTAIVVDSAAPPAELQAADLLRDYLHRMRLTATPLRVLKTSAGQSAKLGTIVLGLRLCVEWNLIPDQDIDAVTPGGHVVHVRAGMVAIAGSDGWATLYGAVAFLERLGARFFLGHPFSGRNPVPDLTGRGIPSFTISDRPVFPFRNGREVLLRETLNELADPRHGATPELFGKDSDLWIDHSAGYLVPRRLYYDQHREYYAQLPDGKRIAKDAFTDHRTPLCLSNPDVAVVAGERVLAWIARNPGKRYFFVTYGDTNLYCSCDACRALDGDTKPVPGRYGSFTHYAARHLHWINPIARVVRQRYPGKIIMTFAYAGSSTPPATGRFEDNVWVVGSTGLGNMTFWDHAVRRNAVPSGAVAKIDGWERVVPGRQLVCEYLGQYEPALLDNMAGRLRWYAAKKLRGVVFTYGRPPNFTSLWQYVFARMKWDPNRDPDQLAEEFIRFYYADAAPAVVELFAQYHKRYVETLENGVELSAGRPVDYYDKSFVDSCLRTFAAAETAATGELRTEIRGEERRFLADTVAHLPDYRFGDETTQRVFVCLKRCRELLPASDKKAETAFIAEVRALSTNLTKHDARYGPLLERWLEQSFWWLKKPDSSDVSTMENKPGTAPDDKDVEDLLEAD